jgi:hypothetical protein
MSGTSTDPKLDRLISTIHQQLNLQETYHNHKEKMAWTATSLFLGFTVLFIGKVATVNCADVPFLFDSAIRAPEILVGIVLLLIYVLTNIFLWMQFSARWDSADISHLLTRYLFKLELIDPNRARNLLHVEPLSTKDSIYPEEIMKLLRIKRARRKWRKVIAQVPRILCKATDERYKSELSSYLIAFILFLSQIAAIVYINYR